MCVDPGESVDEVMYLCVDPGESVDEVIDVFVCRSWRVG